MVWHQIRGLVSLKGGESSLLLGITLRNYGRTKTIVITFVSAANPLPVQATSFFRSHGSTRTRKN